MTKQTDELDNLRLNHINYLQDEIERLRAENIEWARGNLKRVMRDNEVALAVAAEREACARVAESMWFDIGPKAEIAAAIRALKDES